MRPESRLSQLILFQYVLRRPQRGIGVQNPIGNALKGLSLFEVDAQIAQLHLSLGPGESFRAAKSRHVAMLIHRGKRFHAARADTGPKGNPHGFSGCDPHAPPQRQYRIQNRSHRVGQGPRIHDRDRVAKVVTAPKKTRAIGLELHTADGLALQGADVGHPHLGIRRIADSPRGEQCTALGDELRAHEKFGECGVRGVGVGRRQHHLGVSRQLDFTGRDCPRYRDPAHFRVVLGRHEYLRGGEHGAVAAGDFGTVLEICDLVAVGFASDRLVSGRPYLAVDHVAQVHITTPGIAGGVFAPPSHRDVAPAAVSGARRRQHDGIASVRQQVSTRRASPP